MRELRTTPQEAREEERGLMAEDPGMEQPDRGIGEDIILTAAPAVAEAGLEEWEVMPAINRVEMEE
jgi:hypothetical protein